MSVFSEGGYGISESPKTAIERCKRDYESEIAAIQKLKAVSKSLSEAIEGYIDIAGKGEKAFTLTGLYGSLALQDRDLDRTITRLQEQWEAEK